MPINPHIAVHFIISFFRRQSVVSVPRSSGLMVRGICASVLLYIPFVGNVLRVCGLIDASKKCCVKHLQEGWPIGISSGGIAEIFETNVADGAEVIILKNRGGICKLALETGSYLIPTYIFGNNSCLSLWHDKSGFLVSLSRFLQVSICFFWGEYCVVGLSIPPIHCPLLLPLSPRPSLFHTSPSPPPPLPCPPSNVFISNTQSRVLTRPFPESLQLQQDVGSCRSHIESPYWPWRGSPLL